MDSTSTQVFREKLRALNAGEEATVKQIGQGRDIISILSKHGSSIINAFASHLSVKANREAAPEDRLPEDEVLGQMSYVSNFVLKICYPQFNDLIQDIDRRCI
jgi:hypothetical protein